METFIIDVPVPSMGATVSELTVISLKVAPGDQVTKGQKIAELESDKSVFDYEAPGTGKVLALPAEPGQVLESGALFLRLETADPGLRHLEVKDPGAVPAAGSAAPASAAKPLVWTPRALKLAQESGIDPATVAGIEATGPGGRVSGDDVKAYLAKQKA